MKVRKESQALLDSPLVKVRQLQSEVTGTSYLYHSSYLSRAPPLSPLAKREKQGFSTFSNLRLCFPLRPERNWFSGGITWKHGIEKLSFRVVQT